MKVKELTDFAKLGARQELAAMQYVYFIPNDKGFKLVVWNEGISFERQLEFEGVDIDYESFEANSIFAIPYHILKKLNPRYNIESIRVLDTGDCEMVLRSDDGKSSPHYTFIGIPNAEPIGKMIEGTSKNAYVICLDLKVLTRIKNIGSEELILNINLENNTIQYIGTKDYESLCEGFIQQTALRYNFTQGNENKKELKPIKKPCKFKVGDIVHRKNNEFNDPNIPLTIIKILSVQTIPLYKVTDNDIGSFNIWESDLYIPLKQETTPLEPKKLNQTAIESDVPTPEPTNDKERLHKRIDCDRFYNADLSHKLELHALKHGYTSNLWATWRRMLSNGYRVNSGEHGITIKASSFHFTLFNVEQCQEIEAKQNKIGA